MGLYNNDQFWYNARLSNEWLPIIAILYIIWATTTLLWYIDKLHLFGLKCPDNNLAVDLSGMCKYLLMGRETYRDCFSSNDTENAIAKLEWPCQLDLNSEVCIDKIKKFLKLKYS